MTAVLLIALGGAFGALWRWAVSAKDNKIPWGMIAVNVGASWAAAAASDLDDSMRWLVTVGFLGALSTWSSLAVATVRLHRDGSTVTATAVLGGTVAASITAALVAL